ncbi:hypothetical protein Acr_00g0101620 [Actinidia rufa]|uniref:Uncharacterized protein n=1 Tax=Actinidia rufa TaxID=165716 RepID=A0A7J0E2J1_9ERIC|nr:hypothetical protein Acr_00g0101620 [Actinidia rufa]
MATNRQKKPSSDAAADISSADSLSFQGLVCVQDQNPKRPQIGCVLPLPPPKYNPDFVFGHSTPDSTAGNPNKICSADLLFSNGQLLPQAIQSDSNQSQVPGHVNSKDSLPITRRSRSNSSSNSCMRSNDNEFSFSKATKKPNDDVRNQANKNRDNGNRSFSQKIFKSLAAPCRGCHAIEPSRSMKVQTLQQQSLKSH